MSFTSKQYSDIQTSENASLLLEEKKPIILTGYYASGIELSVAYYNRLRSDESCDMNIYNNEREKIIGKLTGLDYQLIPLTFTNNQSHPDVLFSRYISTNEMIRLSNSIEIESYLSEKSPKKHYSFFAPKGYSFLYINGTDSKKIRRLVKHLPTLLNNRRGITSKQREELELLLR